MPYTYRQFRRDYSSQIENIVWICVVLILLSSAIAIPVVLINMYRFRNPIIEVISVTMDPFNISSNYSSHVTTKLNITFSVKNPNNRSHHSWYLQDTSASIFYREENISITDVKPLFQDHEKKGSMQANFEVIELDDVVESSFANSFVEYGLRRALGFNNVVSKSVAAIEPWTKHELGFNVVLKGVITIDPWTEKEYRQWMSVTCKEIRVGFSPNATTGSMLGGSARKCKVLLSDKFKFKCWGYWTTNSINEWKCYE